MLLSYLIIFVVGFFALLFASFILRHIIWALSDFFYVINWILWIAYNPVRWMWKNKNSNFPHKSFIFLQITLIAPLYWVLIHILTTPLRIINALYFDVLLYWSVMFDDSVQDLFIPKRGSYRHQTGAKYFLHWILALPYRLLKFIGGSVITIVDSLFMFAISVVFATFSMFHGTKFEGVATDITQKGKWKVGAGNYAGSGIYFGMRKNVAEHYARSSSGGYEEGIIVVRFTPTLTRNASTLPVKLRQHIGNNGMALAQNIRFPWRTIEHWRDDTEGWWEYCLLQNKPTNTMIKSWRIRPVILLKENKPQRLWGGMYHYSLNPFSFVTGIFSWGVILVILVNTLNV